MKISKEQKRAINALKQVDDFYGLCETCYYQDTKRKQLYGCCNCLEEAKDIVINLVKKLQKENKELEEINNKLEAEKNEAIRRYNFETIPIQKIKDKIEELNQYYKKEIYPNLYQWRDITITEHYDEMIELLQELIKESEE